MQISTIVCLTVVLVLAIGEPATTSAQDADWQKVVAAAKKEGVVNVSSTSLTGKAAVTIMNAFKEKYGISLEVIPGRIAAATEKIMVEQKSKNYVTDSMDAHGANLFLLRDAGYLENVTASLPALKEKDKYIRPVTEDQSGMMLNVLGITTSLCININLVKPGEEPKSFYDLLDPKWKGKILLTNPLYSSSPEQVMLAYTKAKTGLDENFFIKLYKSATVAGPAGGREAVDQLIRGQYAISGFNSGESVLKPILAGAPIKPLDLKEGYVYKAVRVAAIKNAPHPNATKVYINWRLSKEGQMLASKETDQDSVRNDVPSSMPFRFKGPEIILTYEDVELTEKRALKNYMANYVGPQEVISASQIDMSNSSASAAASPGSRRLTKSF